MTSTATRFSMNIFSIVLAASWLSAASTASAAQAKDSTTKAPSTNAATAAQQQQRTRATAQPGTVAARATDEKPNRIELENFDKFLDAHPDINRELRSNPALLDDQKYIQGKPELETFLRSHPGVRDEVRENSQSFMKGERQYENKEAQLESLDRFLDGHPEINTDLRKNPSLVDDQAFLNAHAPLKEFLDAHPGIREQVKANSQAFMRGERQYETREGRQEQAQARLEAFDQFLDHHTDIDQDLRRNPALLNDENYVKKHPGLEDFLRGHPGIREDVSQHAQAFMRREHNYERQEEAAGGQQR